MSKFETFKELELFVKCVSPSEWKIYEDFHTRPDPRPGDKFRYCTTNKIECELTFDKVEFDNNFENGVAFWYIFKNDEGKEFSVYSINHIYDPNKLTDQQRKSIYGFWRYCTPLF